MERLRGTLRRAVSLLLCSTMMVTAAGCSIADYLRPDLNHGADIKVLPDEEGISDEEVMPGPNVAVWPNGSPHNSEYVYNEPNSIVSSDNFEGTPSDMIGTNDYSTYLREQVYEKLLAIIEGLDPEIADKLYIRVGHTGYDMDSSTNTLRRASGWSAVTAGKAVTSAKKVGGGSLITLATDWVDHLSRNQEHQSIQITQAQENLMTYVTEEDMDKSWLELAESNIPVPYYRLFGREGSGFSTLRDYYNAIATAPYNNIPNYTLYVKTGETTYDTMVFNKVENDIAKPYEPGVSLDVVDKLFRTYNQYDTRSRQILEETVSDDDSLLWYYLDGYNKTVVFIGTVAGGNLMETVGQDTYTEMFNIVNGIYSCIDCESILSIVPTVTEQVTPSPDPSADPNASAEPQEPTGPDYSGFPVIPAGTKGVD